MDGTIIFKLFKINNLFNCLRYIKKHSQCMRLFCHSSSNLPIRILVIQINNHLSSQSFVFLQHRLLRVAFRNMNGKGLSPLDIADMVRNAWEQDGNRLMYLMDWQNKMN